jgi:hypothetical protein
MVPREFTLLVVLLCPISSAFAAGETATPTRGAVLERLPPLVFWAWERPCDLDSIDPRAIGVAPLVLTVRLDDAGLALLPRRQPLRFPPGAPLVFVARVETDPRRPPCLDDNLATRTAAAIADFAGGPDAAAVQVDFDATVSEREFYRDLLEALRQRVPARIPLSITALASWCIGDRWLAGLPIDEAVPMLFRMGVDDREVRQRLAAGEDFAEPLCRASVGLATDEPAPRFPTGRRRYLFLSDGCGPAAVRQAQFPTETVR